MIISHHNTMTYLFEPTQEKMIEFYRDYIETSYRPDTRLKIEVYDKYSREICIIRVSCFAFSLVCQDIIETHPEANYIIIQKENKYEAY